MQKDQELVVAITKEDVIKDPNLMFDFLSQPSVDTGIQSEAERLYEQEKLKAFGYDPTPNPMFPEGRGVLDSYQKAVDEGFKAGDPFFYSQDMLQDVSPRAKGEFLGIDYTGGAGNNIIRLYQLLPTDIDNETRIDAVDAMLRKNYTKEFGIPEDYDYDVQLDRSGTVEFTFNDPRDDNKRKPVNPPGINYGDFRSFIEPLSLEIAGGVGGYLAGLGSAFLTKGRAKLSDPYVTTILGEALGTYVYRQNVLDNMVKEGYLPSDYDTTSSAIKDSGMTAAFGVGAATIFKLAALASKAGGAPLGINEDEFIESFEKVANEAEESGLSTSVYTSPQILERGEQMGSKVVLSVPSGTQQQIIDEINVPDSRPEFREKVSEQKTIQREKLDEAFADEDLSVSQALEEGATRDISGRQLQETVTEAVETSPRMVSIERDIDNFKTKSNQTFTSILDNPDANVSDLTRDLQNDFIKLERAKYDELDKAFDDAIKSPKLGKSQVFDLKAGGSGSIEKVAERINRDLTKGFSDKKLAGTFNNIVNKIQESPKISQKIFRNNLSEIRRGLNDAYAAGDATAIEAYTDLLNAHIRTQKRTYKNLGLENEFKQIEGIEKAYEEANAIYRRSVIGDITRVLNDATTREVKVGSVDAFNRVKKFITQGGTITGKGGEQILTSPAFMKEILSDADNKGIQLALSFKQAIKKDLFDNVFDVDEAGNVVPKSPTAFQDYFKTNKDLFKEENLIFTKDEIADLTSVNKASQVFEKDLERLNNLRNIAISEEGVPFLFKAGVLENPEKWFGSFWQPDNITQSGRLFRILTDDKTANADIVESVRSNIYNDILEKTSKTTPQGDKVFDSTKLDAYLDDYRTQLTQWYGKDFVPKMKSINTRLKVFDDPTGKGLAQGDYALFKAVNSIARAQVGMFTREGRIMTAVKMVGSMMFRQRDLDLLLDPDKLYKRLMKDKFVRDPRTRAVVRALGRVFYRESANDIEGEEDPTLEEDLTNIGDVLRLKSGGLVRPPLIKLKYKI